MSIKRTYQTDTDVFTILLQFQQQKKKTESEMARESVDYDHLVRSKTKVCVYGCMCLLFLPLQLPAKFFFFCVTFYVCCHCSFCSFFSLFLLLSLFTNPLQYVKCLRNWFLMFYYPFGNIKKKQNRRNLLHYCYLNDVSIFFLLFVLFFCEAL